ncbi:MAG: outer membrane beta-barrel protein [Gammaproteobacteria bacterium]|nr:outer membrane beta-barrel protein [Gammaproteobacteria bacterium]
MKKQWTMGLLMTASSLSMAGTMGENPTSFAGFWGGIGGSYTYSTLGGKTSILQVNSAPSSAQYTLSDSILNHMAPVVDAGYYFPIGTDWVIGPKFLYKYIGQEQFDQTWSGTYQDGSYQTAGLRTKSIQDFNLFLSGGYQFNQWLLYAGAGPGWANARVDLNGSLLPATSVVFTPVNVSHSKTMIGGAAQVGFEYMLPMRFTVDISYNFLAVPSTLVSPITFNSTGGNYASFSQSLNVVEQGINVSLNKYFW